MTNVPVYSQNSETNLEGDIIDTPVDTDNQSTESTDTQNSTSTTVPKPTDKPVEKEVSALGRNFGCGNIPVTKITLRELVSPASFTPIIPLNCGTNGNEIIPLSPVLIPVVITRFFGFISSLIFYLVNGVIVFAGIQYIWNGIDGAQVAKAKKNFSDGIFALILILSTYLIIGTILGVIGGTNIETDVGKLFNTQTK